MIIWKIIRSVLCSIVYTVQCTHMNRPNCCLLVSLACLWLYCVLQFICVRFSFLWLFFVTSIVYLCIHMCFCRVKFSFCSTVPKDCLWRTSPKWCILCRVRRKTWTLAGINALSSFDIVVWETRRKNLFQLRGNIFLWERASPVCE